MVQFDDLPTVCQGAPSSIVEISPPDDDVEWPRISIVVPSYQQGRYLEETLRSVLSQAYPDLELLVIDGGSSDDTVEILRRYDRWISYWTSEPDRGQSDAINKGFARASGEIVTFLGSDDLYEDGTLLDVGRRYLREPACGAIVGAFRFLDESPRRLSAPVPARLPGPGPHDLTLLDPGSWRLHQVSAFYTRHALDEVGRRVEEELTYTMDRELLYRVARRFPINLSDRTYGQFRRHPESKSVASTLPMSREMGALHLPPWVTGEFDHATRRRRRRLARYHWARGEWKLARAGVGSWRGGAALLRAVRHRPDLLFRPSFLATSAEVLGVAKPLRRMVRVFRGLRDAGI